MLSAWITDVGGRAEDLLRGLLLEGWLQAPVGRRIHAHIFIHNGCRGRSFEVQEENRERGGTRDMVLTLGFCLDGVQIDEHAQP